MLKTQEAPGLSWRVGQKIRERRRKQKFSQERLGRKASLKRSSISRLEEGNCHKVSLEALQRIARVLGCDLAALFAGEEDYAGPENTEIAVNRFAYKAEYPGTHVTLESILPEKSPVLIGRVHLPPVTGISPRQINGRSRAFIVMSSGRLVMRANHREHFLKEKDCLYVNDCVNCEIYNSDPVRPAVFWIFSFSEQ